MLSTNFRPNERWNQAGIPIAIVSIPRRILDPRLNAPAFMWPQQLRRKASILSGSRYFVPL